MVRRLGLVVHTTCKTHLKGEVKATRERRAAGEKSAGQHSAALMEAHQDKLDRYSLLEAMVERQVLSGLRSAAPLVLPVVVSTHGECCPGTVRLQEWVMERYRARLRLEGERDDGEKEDDLITAFRCELRAALLVATAKGTAEMLAVAGRPFSKGRAQRCGALPGARAPAARTAGHGADDSLASDGPSSDSCSDTTTDSDSDSSIERGGGDSDSSSTTQTNDSDSTACGGSGSRGRSRRWVASHAQTQPRVSTRSSARLAQQRSIQPDPASDSVSTPLSRPGSSSSCSSSSSSSSRSSIFCSSSSVYSSSSYGEVRCLVDGGSQDQLFPIVDSL